jgi:hypothetical protein
LSERMCSGIPRTNITSAKVSITCKLPKRRATRNAKHTRVYSSSGQGGGAGSGQRLHLGPQSREHLRDRTLRRGQELSRLSPGTESLSRRLLGSLSSRRCLTAGPRLGPSRWQLAPPPGSTQSHRGSGHPYAACAKDLYSSSDCRGSNTQSV